MMKSNNDFYYWSHNARMHYLTFRNPVDRTLAKVQIRPLLGRKFACYVYTPKWNAYEAIFLEEGKAWCESIVDEVLREHYKELYLSNMQEIARRKKK